MRYSVCSLCGRQLLTPGPYLIRKDERDKYHDFHSIRWSICDVCDQELQARAEQVKKDLAHEAELDRNGESPIIEFQI